MATTVARFGDYPGASVSGAIFSQDDRYRYLLMRRFEKMNPTIHFCMLNPATADENKDDPTVKRCIVRGRQLGYNTILGTNLFAYRGGDPAILREIDDPIGGDITDNWIKLSALTSDVTVVGWGEFGKLNGRGEKILEDLRLFSPTPLYCMGKTKAGYPRHPLYVSYNKKLEVFDE